MSEFIGQVQAAMAGRPKAQWQDDPADALLASYDPRLPLCRSILRDMPGQGHNVWRLLRAYALRSLALREFASRMPEGDIKRVLMQIHDGKIVAGPMP